MKTVLGWTRNVWRFEEHGDCDYRLCLLQQEIIDGVAFYKAWNEWLRDHSVIFHDCIQCPSAISYCTSELQFVACLDVWECVCVCVKSGTKKKAQMRHCWWRSNLEPGIYKYTLQTMERKYLSTGDCINSTFGYTSAWRPHIKDSKDQDNDEDEIVIKY